MSLMPEPGVWYIGPTCGTCKKPIAAFKEKYKGQVDFKGSTMGGPFGLVCPHCGTDGIYYSGEMSEFQG